MNQNSNSGEPTPTVSSDYEKCREERIRENLERMQKLGIYDLSLKLKSIKPNAHRKNNKPSSNKTPNLCIPPLPSSVSTRRSSRLQNTPAVSYTEVDLSKKSKDGVDELMRENSRPEIYTEEHEKLLGDTKTEWTLFVDGYGKDGKKIYDQVRGKTCHQCRQKTLGYRTRCCKCDLVQGQFCGDCLYMRYGENVLEAMQNPDWVCPGCRGICNCSLCRQAKGWAPTGILYRKISSLGYKSVAHYLIQTRRSDPSAEKNAKTEASGCAKEDEKPMEKESLGENVELESGRESKEKNVDENENEIKVKDESEVVLGFMKEESKDENEMEVKDESEVVLGFTIEENKDENEIRVKDESEVVLGFAKEENEDENEINVKDESGIVLGFAKEENKDDEVKTAIVTPETGRGSRKKWRTVTEPVPENSIAGRLRSRRKCT